MGPERKFVNIGSLNINLSFHCIQKNWIRGFQIFYSESQQNEISVCSIFKLQKEKQNQRDGVPLWIFNLQNGKTEKQNEIEKGALSLYLSFY